MKTAGAMTALAALGCAHAFVVPTPRTALRAGTETHAERINQTIDLDSPKVATMDTVETGEKKVYCRCWMSGTFPLCDGSHVAHNKETGDNVGPLIVSGPK